MAVGSIGAGVSRAASGTVLPILCMISAGHFLNDMMQSLLPAIYPMLKDNYALDFGQIGLITWPSRSPRRCCSRWSGSTPTSGRMPYSLPFGMASTLRRPAACWRCADSFAACCVGGGADRHRLVGLPSRSPRAWRALASGGRYGLAQSLFQVGGNFGPAIGPLLAALSSCCRTARAASPGSRSRRWSASSCCGGSAAGTASHLRDARRGARRRSRALRLSRAHGRRSRSPC